METDMIKITHLKKSFGDVKAVNDLSFQVKKGELFAFLGVNGAGKSTTISIICGQLRKDSGTVQIQGTDLDKIGRKVGTMLGVVFQDFRLLKDRTIFENVAFAQQVVEVPHRYIKRQVENMLEMVGLKDRMNAFPNELSGGEQQRVAIARALVNHPVLLLADEPTGNLDPVTAKGIMELLSEINKSGTTVLVVTHNKELVNEMGKRVILIEDGHIEQDEIRGSYDI